MTDPQNIQPATDEQIARLEARDASGGAFGAWDVRALIARVRQAEAAAEEARVHAFDAEAEAARWRKTEHIEGDMQESKIAKLQAELNAVIDLSTEHEMEAAHQGDLIARMRDVVEAAIEYVTSTDSFTTSYRTLDAPLRESVRAYLAESPLDVA